MKSARLFTSLLAVVVCLLAVSSVRAEDWKPIDPAHLAMKEPKVEKDADAEALIWEVRIDDSGYDLVFNHYLRIKIFNERGVESQSKVDIAYSNDQRIRDIAARTIKPDGSIVELNKDSVYDRTIVKVSGFRIKAKSFAMPGVEPGAIIEYRYREVHEGSAAYNLKLYLQRTIPVHEVKYFLKPADSPLLGVMRTITFNGSNPQFNKEKNGYYSTGLSHVPAYREEAWMPPEDKVRIWMLVYYSREAKVEPEKFWNTVGKNYYETFKPKTKVNDDVRRRTEEVITGATTADEKLRKILMFCRTQIRNVWSDTTVMSAEERRKLKDNNNPGDTLKRGYGTGNDIDYLFTAMATAAGFEARLALVPDRSKFFFDPGFPTTYFMDGGEIAVQVDGQWKFYDPSGKYVTMGMLPWFYEGVQALITDPKASVWAQTPMSAAAKSVEKRTAKMKLSEDGTLEGDVRIEYTGHLALQKKRDNDDDTPEKREETLRDMVRSRLSTAELSSLRIENVTDQSQPFVYSYHVKVPGYAQRTGKRLFLQPAYFQQGKAPLFAASERRYPIYINFPWSELDTVEIELPAGFVLDNAEAPNAIRAGEVSSSEIALAITQDKKTLIMNRKFQFGADGTILFPTTTYPNLKRLFDAYHKLDGHTITLRQDAAVAGQ